MATLVLLALLSEEPTGKLKLVVAAVQPKSTAKFEFNVTVAGKVSRVVPVEYKPNILVYEIVVVTPAPDDLIAAA
jgi:hypothetical protein